MLQLCTLVRLIRKLCNLQNKFYIVHKIFHQDVFFNISAVALVQKNKRSFISHAFPSGLRLLLRDVDSDRSDIKNLTPLVTSSNPPDTGGTAICQTT